MTMNTAWLSWYDIDRIYELRKQRSGLEIIQDSVDTSIRRLEDNIKSEKKD